MSYERTDDNFLCRVKSLGGLGQREKGEKDETQGWETEGCENAICYGFAVDLAYTIWDFLRDFSTGVDVSEFSFETIEKYCTSWQVWCRQKQRLLWGMTHNWPQQLRWPGKGERILLQVSEALASTGGIEPNCGWQASVWVWYWGSRWDSDMGSSC